MIYTPVVGGCNVYFESAREGREGGEGKRFISFNRVAPFARQFPDFAASLTANRLFLAAQIGLKSSKNRVFTARTEKRSHGTGYRRTNWKWSRTERQIARTERVFAARTGKCAHETVFARTEPKLSRTD
jgi:hypothetical protein